MLEQATIGTTLRETRTSSRRGQTLRDAPWGSREHLRFGGTRVLQPARSKAARVTAASGRGYTRRQPPSVLPSFRTVGDEGCPVRRRQSGQMD